MTVAVVLYIVVNTVSKTAGNLTVVVSRAAAGTLGICRVLG